MFGHYWSKGADNFESLEADLKGIMVFVAKHMTIEPFYGHRGAKEQNDLFEKGRSEKKYPNSKHNKHPSQAVDIQIYVGGKATWQTSKYIQLWHLISFYCMDNDISIRWGGNWDNDNTIIDDQDLDDLMHFELA